MLHISVQGDKISLKDRGGLTMLVRRIATRRVAWFLVSVGLLAGIIYDYLRLEIDEGSR
jgi:hypothetical protein